MCGSRKHPYIYPPCGGLLEILRSGGALKTKTFKEKYEAKLEFPEEIRGGAQKKKLSVGGV